MTSNIFSRFTPSGRGDRPFFEELRDEEGDGNGLDGEERSGFALDEENLNQQFQDYDLEHAEGLGMGDSRATVASAAGPAMTGAAAMRSHGQPRRNISRPRWAVPGAEDDGDNDDVPGSLLVEAHGPGQAPLPPLLKAAPLRSNVPKQGTSRPNRGVGAVPGAATKRNRALWDAAQNQQRLHNDEPVGASEARAGDGQSAETSTAGPGNALLSYFKASGGRRGGNPQDIAMWRWVNVTNLDNFIRDVYDYHRACGLRCILVERLLHLVNVAFVAVFLTFLTQCLDYSKIRGSTEMNQILVPQCTRNMSWIWNLGLWLFAFYFIWKTMQFFIFDMRRLLNLRDFFVYLLQIPEHDMQTVSWQDVVVKIMALRDQNPKTAINMTRVQREWIGSQSKERLDAHDIANRLMRRENYLIALFNKDILNLDIPLPFLRNTQLLTRTLEWTLWFAVLDFVFDERGQVNQEFLKASRRSQLSLKLKSRFLFAGFMNLLLAPFVACYLVIIYFLTYYNEYQKNPSALGARAYTPLAEWKFREFNELDHLFEERLNMSYPFATRYLEQFPKKKTEQVAKTVAFIAGSVMTVLAIASLVDPELFLGFEITHDRTVLFYVGIFATVWATARGMITEENSVFDPEYALRNVIEYTHYEPDHWKGRLHSHSVKMEFSELYQNKIKIFLEEIVSILITPLVLFVSLPKCSDQIVDFFREFTIHVDGLGYVCSFAVFDFNKDVNGGGAGAGGTGGSGSNPKRPKQPDPLGAGADVRDDYYSTKHGKMAASYYGFLDNYVINPKTGIPGHHPPGGRHHYSQFHPPPAFPGLNSPTLAADMQSSRMRMRAGGGGGGGAGPSQSLLRTPRFGPTVGGPQPSPMASILLDPHNQPSASTFASRSVHRLRTRGGFTGDGHVIQEPVMEGDDGEDDDGSEQLQQQQQQQQQRLQQQDEEQSEVFQGGAGLEESTWQTSPPKAPSRESSSGVADDADVGVLGLMYQFQQAHMNHKPGGGR